LPVTPRLWYVKSRQDDMVQTRTVFNFLRNILAIVGLLAILASALAGTVVHYFSNGNESEIYRLSSPNKEYDAVVTTHEPVAAFGSSTVRLYVVPAGVSFDKGSEYYKFEVLRSETILVDRLKWRDDRNLLVVRGPKDHIDQFDPVRYDPRDLVPNGPDEEHWRRVTVVIQTDENL